MELVDNVPLIITETGEIKLFNNVGFSTIAKFPFAFEPVFPRSGNSYTNPNHTNRAIHPKGIKVKDDKVYMFVNFPVIGDLPANERTMSGIWVLDIKTRSLTHTASPDNEQIFDRVSPILVLNNSEGRLVVGGDSDTSGVGVWVENLDNDATQYGYIVTSEIEADSIQDIFSQIVSKALIGTNDKIVVKYRGKTDTSLPIYADVVWANSTSFNTTADLAYIKTRYDLGHRDEVEIVVGSGAGRLAHITNITNSGNTYQVTIDESLGTQGATAKVRIDNWIKIPETMTSSDGEVKRLGVGLTSSWCQFKIEMRGRAGRPEIREIQILTNNKEKK